jgi:2-keto-3-deoxy-L-rhamnonate aldolase RhmA
MIRELEKAQRLRNQLAAGQACLGAQIGLADPAVVEILGRVGYDWLIVDTEHAASTTLTMQAMLQAGGQSEALVLARALRLDPDEIRRFLDIGSPGIVCPFINSGEDARKLVSACRYPPEGIRGYGPRRAGVFGLDAGEYFKTANEIIVCIPIVESKEAVEKIEEIVSTDGIDAVLIGPVDLSISLGAFGQYDHSSYTSAVDTVRHACKKHGVAMGTGCYSREHARKCMLDGDQLLLIGGDDSFLATEARRCLEEVRKRSS